MSTAEKEKVPTKAPAPAAAAAEKSGGGEVKERKTFARKRGSQWTLNRCKKYARRWKTEKEWMEFSPASYKSATYWGWVDACCEHMDKSARLAHAPVKTKTPKLKAKATPIVSEMVAEADVTEKPQKTAKKTTKTKEEKTSKKKVS